jgi:suppressor of ftsI
VTTPLRSLPNRPQRPSLDRRRFIIGSAAALGAAATLELDACGGGGSPAVPASGAVYTLRVGYTTTIFPGGYTLHTRTYDGRTVGPTLETTPGSTLTIRIENMLPPNPPAKIPTGRVRIPQARDMASMHAAALATASVPASGLNVMNNPHSFNTTNLHVHGIQTIPHLFEPLGTSNPSAMMIGIEPGDSFTYAFPIPADHPSGLFWYHPHHHGATDVQVSGGMAGLLIVRGPIDAVPEIAAAREILIAIQTIQVNPSSKTPGTYDYEPVAYEAPPPTGNGYSLGPQFAFVTVNGKAVTVNNGNTGSWTPSPPPLYAMQPGEIVRLRILNGANFLILPLTIPGMDVFVIGNDGINTLAPQAIAEQAALGTVVSAATRNDGKNILLSPGGRAELLVRAPRVPGTFPLVALSTSDVSFMPFPQIVLAKFTVGGVPVSMQLPATLPTPTREYPPIGESEIVARRSLTFSENSPATDVLTGVDFWIDGKLYDEMRIDARPKIGTAEEWTVINTSSESHPFHLHVNSIEVISINDVPLATTTFVDTVLVPSNGKVVFRSRFKQFTGKSVYHCHTLPHEDTGMMGNILLS